MKYPIDRDKLNEYFQKKKGHAVTAYSIACAVGVERVYGGTMARWCVRKMSCEWILQSNRDCKTVRQTLTPLEDFLPGMDKQGKSYRFDF